MIRNEQKKEYGITLIALVVTIVVLLILAGVTITFVLGEGGILDMAKETADKTKNSVANEQSDMTNLAEDIQNFVYGSSSGNSSSESNTLTEAEKETITIGEARKTWDYGRIVNEYNVTTDEFESGVWRLFYQDDDYTYIIADELVGDYTLSDKYADYADGSMVSKIGQNLNSKLKNADCDKGCKFFEVGNTNSNIRAVAWLTDEEQWKEYATGKGALYAIGTPTAELFAASYNAVQDVNEITLELGPYGYTFDLGVEGWFRIDEFGGIYNKTGSSGWFLASPSDFVGNDGMVVVAEPIGFLNGGFADGSAPIRPIVCFRTTVFNDTYTLGDM